MQYIDIYSIFHHRYTCTIQHVFYYSRQICKHTYIYTYSHILPTVLPAQMYENEYHVLFETTILYTVHNFTHQNGTMYKRGKQKVKRTKKTEKPSVTV